MQSPERSRDDKPPPGAIKEFVIGTMAEMLAGSGLKEFASFDPRTPAGAILLLTATTEDLPQLASMAKEYINVQNVYSHEVVSADEDNGEAKVFQRTVLFTEDGKAYSCGSIGVAKAIGTIARIRGLPTWDPPVRCQVVLTRLDGKKQWLTLKPDTATLFPNQTTPAR